MGYGDFSAIPHGRYEYEKEYVLLDLVFIWLKEHSLIVLLLLGTIFNVFWLYRMRRQLQMKWYAVIAFSVLHTVCGVLSVKAFAFLETGDAGNMSLFGGVFFMPVLYFISAKVSKRNIKAVFDIFTICMIFTVMCARVNCIVSGCCAGLVIPGTHVHFHAGITNCQSTDFRKLDFHFNASLAAINLAKAACKRIGITYSISSCKSFIHNAYMLERFICVFGISPDPQVIDKLFKELILFTARAA